MIACDLCAEAPVIRAAFLGGRSDRRVWLCEQCHERLSDHGLAPAQLMQLARRAASRVDRCDWCTDERPAVQARVHGAHGRVFSFSLCSSCARQAAREDGARILSPEAARDGETTHDPKYERALSIHRRRQQFRRVK